MSDYCELHLHDYYSSLDGLNSPAEYMQRAKELGMTHLAQTNHGTLGGHREFQMAAAEAGITPILGLESYITLDRFDKRSKASRQDGTSIYNHIILLAQNEVGLKTLNRLSEKAWSEGLYYKPRIDTELLFSDNDGIIALSGCMSGMIPKALEAGDVNGAIRIAKEYQAALGDRFYIEVQGHNPLWLNMALLELADKLKIKAVATSDCHYARKEDLWLEEAMLIISSNPKRDFSYDYSKTKKMDILSRYNYLYPERTMSFEKIEIFLRDRVSNQELFVRQGFDRTDIFDNTVEIASRIGDYPFYKGLDLLPRPKNGNADELLSKKAWAGLSRRGFGNNPQYRQRLQEELDIIKNKGFSSYILIVANMIQWAKRNDIPVGPGRGSSAGSLVCYACEITDVDPIKHGLLFFRFIDPNRDDFPDIDTDFGDRRRGEVKQYLQRQYKNVASIATFNRFQGKNSLKDAARVLGIPVGEVNKATKNNDAPPNIYYYDVFDKSEQGIEFTNKYPEAVELAKRLYGKLRGGGMHAAGVVIANQSIEAIAPLETAKDPNDPNGPRIPYIAYDMDQIAQIGLIKLDILGLKAMTIIDDTLKMIKSRHGLDIDLHSIDFQDNKVYGMISDGYTKGVFQCEQAPYTGLILKMGGVFSFAELAASNALVRPGAANTIGPEYIARKNGKSMVRYVHPDVQGFTEETYGEVLYQEQVMLMMTELAGMTMAEANQVRKIIGKKKDPVEFEKFKDRFISGASLKVRKEVAEKLWKDFEAHAGYSFNKSHAVAYSMISYWTAWLKFHYPLEFMTSTLSNESNKDAITDYLIESKRLGLRVLLPNVNESEAKISIQNEGIRLGLVNIKFISDNVASKIIEHRPFATYKQLEEKVFEKGSGLNSRVLTALNAIGAAVFPDNPLRGNERENFYEYLSIPAFDTKQIKPYIKFKFRDLDEYSETGAFPILGMVRGIKRGPGWARVEVVDETGSAGIFASDLIPIESGQMYVMLVSDNRIVKYMTMDELYDGVNSSLYKWLVERQPSVPENLHRIIAFQKRVTKAGKNMAYVIAQNHLGQLESIVVFPSKFISAYSRCVEGKIVSLSLKESDSGSLILEEVNIVN